MVVDALQPGLGDVGVELGRRQALVSQQFLDDSQIGAALDEVGRVGVAKCVGVHVTPRHALVEHATHVAWTQTATTPVQEESLTR